MKTKYKITFKGVVKGVLILPLVIGLVGLMLFLVYTDSRVYASPGYPVDDGYPIETDYPVLPTPYPPKCEKFFWMGISPVDCDKYYQEHPEEYCYHYPEKCITPTPPPQDNPIETNPQPYYEPQKTEPVLGIVYQVVTLDPVTLKDVLRCITPWGVCPR